jgi:MacB-like periplasmic core domain
MHDEEKAPNVAVVNREFARKLFGSVDKAVGQHFKFWGGQRAEVIGVVEDGKYQTLTEDQMPAMFFSFLQHQGGDVWILVRSGRDPQEIGAALQRSMRSLDPTLPLEINTWNSEMDSALFAARVATVALGVLGLLGAMLAITGIFGIASYKSTRGAERGARPSFPPARCRVGGRHDPRCARHARSFVDRLPGNAKRPAHPWRSCSHHAGCGYSRCIHPGPTRSRCRPDDTASRGMSRRNNRYLDS